MRRGELYRVYKGSAEDPGRYRVFAVVSRQTLLDSRFSTAICAPVYTSFDGLSSQVPVGVDEGLKHNFSIHCDELISISRRVSFFSIFLIVERRSMKNRYTDVHNTSHPETNQA